MASGFDPEQPVKGIGRRLIAALTQQVQRRVALRQTAPGGGATFTLDFPARFCQELARKRALGLGQRRRRAFEHHRAAVVPGPGPRSITQSAREIDIEIVLDDDHGRAGIDQPVEQADQRIDIVHVKAGGRLVEHIDIAGLAELRRELQPLALAARECRERLAQRQVAEADIDETLQDLGDRPVR